MPDYYEEGIFGWSGPVATPSSNHCTRQHYPAQPPPERKHSTVIDLLLIGLALLIAGYMEAQDDEPQ